MSSPYQTPLEAPPESGFSLEDIRSGPRAKFFGIGHIALAALGFISSVGLGILLIQISHTQAEFEENLRGSSVSTTSSLLAEFAAIRRYGLLVTLATAICTVPLLISGILLLRRRPSAVIWSNLYAIFSIGGKISMIAYVINHLRSTPDPLVSPENIGDLVFSAALFIYPVLSLILLNRPAFKRWLAGAEAA